MKKELLDTLGLMEYGLVIPDRASWETSYQLHSSKRLKVEELLSQSLPRDATRTVFGYCEVCERATEFLLDWLYSDGAMVNFRERLVCGTCHLNNRLRFMVAFLKKIVRHRNVKGIYMYEQVTELYKACRRIFSDIRVTGSEYLGNSLGGGQTVNGIRHEDALRLSFPSGEFDAVISCDVYEHIPDIKGALKEAFRILKDDGLLIFSIPFYIKNDVSTLRAELKDGIVQHLKPETYHGNPLSEKGSLVFYDFGWDVLDMCKQAGFNRAYMISYYSTFYGYLGGGMQHLFVAEK